MTGLPAPQLTALAAAALDGAGDLIGFLGADGAVLFANGAACAELGVTPEEVLRFRIFDVLPSLTPELWAQRWVEFRAGGRLRFVDKMRRRDGTLFPVDVHASLVVQDGVEYALVVARDMTDRRRAELALRESAEAFRALAENNPALVMRWGRDRRILYVNPPGAALAGRPVDELIGQSAFELLSGEAEAGLIDETIERVFRAGEAIQLMVSAYGRDFDWRVAPERSERGEVVSVLGVATDMTEQKALELELRDSRDFFSQVIANAEEGIVVVDRELRYLMRNHFMEELTGIPTEGMLGTSVLERSVPQLDELIRYIETALAGNMVRSQDIKVLVRPGMPEIWVQTMYSPLRDGAGAVTGVIMIVHDVTARRESEREQRQVAARLLESQKLESLGVLAGGIAHDFNNLLVGVLGNAGLMLADPSLGEPQRERLREIELAARRASDLTRQMLTYAGRGRAAVIPLDLSELVHETIDLVRAAIPRAVLLELGLETGLPSVTADRSQLQQVAMNLVINAGEAVTTFGGEVSVRTLAVELDERAAEEAGSAGGELAAGTYVVLEVSDTGPGMDAETIARAFEPFFSTKGTGRGLGLSSVLGIVRGHRGALRVESVPGVGTTFRVLLPASPAGTVVPVTWRGDVPVGDSARAESRVASSPVASSPVAAPVLREILLVEDEAAVARTVRRMLEAAGFVVTLAEDGQQALDVLEVRQPGEFAAVVLDLAMPRVGGREVYLRLRETDSYLPVLVTSGYADGEDGVPEPDDLRAEFLAKPYTPMALTAALERLLDPAISRSS